MGGYNATHLRLKFALGAYNGSAYISDVASVTVYLDDYGNVNVPNIINTPAGTTNIRWRIYEVDHSTGFGSVTISRMALNTVVPTIG